MCARRLPAASVLSRRGGAGGTRTAQRRHSPPAGPAPARPARSPLPGQVSVDGTHLGHNLPDRRGNRYCINLACIAGRPSPGPAAAAADGDSPQVE